VYESNAYAYCVAGKREGSAVMTDTIADFRGALLSDADTIADVYLASRKAFVSYAPLAHSDDEVRGWISGVLIPSGGVTVAVVSAAVVGMLAISHADGYGWIDHLYLLPTATGRGIGGQMLDLAKKQLGTPIRLYTFQENVGARRFYERHGFHAIAFSDGADNEENCPDVLYEWNGARNINVA
jgi:ribosomal protein S18 acetylase RimI-like enzyme